MRVLFYNNLFTRLLLFLYLMHTFGSSTYHTSHSFNSSTNYFKKNILNPWSFNCPGFFFSFTQSIMGTCKYIISILFILLIDVKYCVKKTLLVPLKRKLPSSLFVFSNTIKRVKKLNDGKK